MELLNSVAAVLVPHDALLVLRQAHGLPSTVWLCCSWGNDDGLSDAPIQAMHTPLSVFECLLTRRRNCRHREDTLRCALSLSLVLLISFRAVKYFRGRERKETGREVRCSMG